MAEYDTNTRYIGQGGRGQRSRQAVNAAMRSGGGVDTSKKFASGGNKQSQTNLNTAKLDQETEELRHEHLQVDVCKLIQQGRQAKGMTQKDLATKINEKQQVVNEYEAGRAIPNQQIISKLERVLGMKLRGRDKGKQLK